MSLQAITERMKTLNGEVDGIRTAVEDPPDSLDTARLPLVYTLVSEGDLDYQANDLARTDHHLLIQVWGEPIGQDQSTAKRIDALKPLVARFRDKYAAHLRLDSLSDVDHAYLTLYRLGVRDYAGVPHAMLEFEITVVEKEVVTVDV